MSVAHVRRRLLLLLVLLVLVTGCGADPEPGRPPPLRGLSPEQQERRDARVLTDGCEYGARGVPTCGVLLGAAYGGNRDPSEWERRMGHPLGVRRTYYGPDDVAYAVETARQDLVVGRIPWISFKLPHSWTQMAEGEGDEWAEDLADRLARIDGPVWLAFHHEPEGDGDIMRWKAMQERLAPMVRDRAPNVAYTVVLTGYHQVFGDGTYALDRIWPDAPVDLAGFDVYERYLTERDGEVVDQQTPFDTYLGAFADFSREQGVPWGIAETGLSDAAAEAEPDLLRDHYDEVGAAGGVAFVYFNSVLNSTASWRLDPEKEELFSEVLADAPRL